MYLDADIEDLLTAADATLVSRTRDRVRLNLALRFSLLYEACFAALRSRDSDKRALSEEDSFRSGERAQLI